MKLLTPLLLTALAAAMPAASAQQAAPLTPPVEKTQNGVTVRLQSAR